MAQPLAPSKPSIRVSCCHNVRRVGREGEEEEVEETSSEVATVRIARRGGGQPVAEGATLQPSPVTLFWPFICSERCLVP